VEVAVRKLSIDGNGRSVWLVLGVALDWGSVKFGFGFHFFILGFD